MKSIPVSSILYFLLSLGVLFVNANTFTDSQIFPKWMFMFTGLGVIGCFFSYVNIKRPTHKVGQVYTKIDINPRFWIKERLALMRTQVRLLYNNK